MPPAGAELAAARAAAAAQYAAHVTPAQPSFAALLLAWLLTGLLGGHHFLLRRHVHGLLWLTSCGGFGVGWALDLFRLSRLRAEAAGDRPAVVSRAGVVTPQARPGAGGARGVQHYAAQTVLSRYYYALVRWAALLLGAPGGVAHGAGLAAVTATVWAVDNAGLQRGSSRRAVALAGAAGAAAATALGAHAPLLWTTTAAQVASWHTRRWRAPLDPPLSGRGALRATAALALLAALLAARLLALPGGDAAGSARARLGELLDSLGIRVTVNAGGAGGGGDSWQRGGGGARGFDFGGLARGMGGMSRREAARMLGVGAGADERAVKEAFRRLSLQHHPDKAAPGDAAAAAAMQTKLNAAREVLLKSAAAAAGE